MDEDSLEDKIANDKRIQLLLKQSEEAQTIKDLSVFDRNALGFFHSLLLLCTLPHKDPKDLEVFKRSTDDVHLGIRSGYDVENEKQYGIPFGPYPRLILAFIISEVVNEKSKVIRLGSSLNEFMGKLGIAPSGPGKKRNWSSANDRLKMQMQRLFNAEILIKRITKTKYKKTTTSAKMQMVDALESQEVYFWDSKVHPTQKMLFDMTICLSDNFYNEIMKNPVPIDLNILKAIKKSPLAIDLYLFLTYKSFRLKGRTLEFSWKALHNQFGTDYKSDIKFFTREAKKHIKNIKKYYPDLQVDYEYGKLLILPNSKPSVKPKKNTE
jgi:hypothetical protein